MTVVNGVGPGVNDLWEFWFSHLLSITQSLSFPRLQNGLYRQTEVVSAWKVDCTPYRMAIITLWY